MLLRPRTPFSTSLVPDFRDQDFVEARIRQVVKGSGSRQRLSAFPAVVLALCLLSMNLVSCQRVRPILIQRRACTSAPYPMCAPV